MPYIGRNPDKGNFSDLNGAKLILDADADTHITADTDDQIDIQIAGADDFQMTANTFTVLSGSTLAIASGATIANSGTATGFSSADPSSADGDTLGTASAEWSDLYLADGGIIYFGADQDVTLTHVADTGLLLNSTMAIQFNDASQYINAPSATVLDINATDEIELNATAVDLNGTLDVSGALTTAAINASGVVGITTAHDLGAGLHIRTADSGGSAHADADELVIEGSGNSGMTFLAGTSSTSNINFGDSGSNVAGQIIYDHSNTWMRFMVEASSVMFMDNDKSVYIGGSTNANTSNGSITLQQDGADDEIFALKSTDVAHGVTDITETDTYFNISKFVGAEGTPIITGYGEDQSGLFVRGVCVVANTTKSTSANAPIVLRGVKKSSATTAVMGSNENVVVIAGCTAGPGFIFDAEGSMHSNASNAVYDEYDDAELVRTIEQSLSTKGLIASKFDEFVQYSHEDLADAGLVGREDDGSPNNWINWMHLSKLHNGAIWQQYEKHANLLNAVYELASESVGKDRANEILEKHDVKLLSKNELLN